MKTKDIETAVVPEALRFSTADKALKSYLHHEAISYDEIRSYLLAFSDITSNLSILLCDLRIRPSMPPVLTYYKKSQKLNTLWRYFTELPSLDSKEDQQRFLGGLYGIDPFLKEITEGLFFHIAYLHGIAPDRVFEEFMASSTLTAFIMFKSAATELPKVLFNLSIPHFNDFCEAAQFIPPFEPLRVLSKLSQFVMLRKFYISKPHDEVRTIEFSQQKAAFNLEIESRICKALHAKTYTDALNCITNNHIINASILTLRKAEGQLFGHKAAVRSAQTIIDEFAVGRVVVEKQSMSEVESIVAKLEEEMIEVDIWESITRWPICLYKGKSVHSDFLLDMARMHEYLRKRSNERNCEVQTTWSGVEGGVLSNVE